MFKPKLILTVSILELAVLALTLGGLLQVRLVQLEASTVAAQATRPVTPRKRNLNQSGSILFPQNLKLKDLGDDVHALQVILNRNPKTQIAKRGKNAPGKETGLFDGATKRAVVKFQRLYRLQVQRNKLGLVEEKTREKLREIAGNKPIVVAIATSSSTSSRKQGAGGGGGGGGGGDRGGGNDNRVNHPPHRRKLSPFGTHPADTTSLVLSLETDKEANCRFSLAPSTPFGSMGETFASPAGTLHTRLVSDLEPGNTYIYYVRCSDTEGNANDDDAQLSFSIASQNDAILVRAGIDQSATLGTPITLSGSVTNLLHRSLIYSWTQVSGSGTATFGNTSQLRTTASFSAAGIYRLRLTATSGRISSSDILTVTVLRPNTAPIVNAGANQTIAVSAFPATFILNGTATDDGLPVPPGRFVTAWSKQSGPGNTSFSATGSLQTTVNVSSAGIYVLRLTASDGALSSTSDVSVTVSLAAGNSSSSNFIPNPNTKDKMLVGMNLEGLSYYMQGWNFVDAMKRSEGTWQLVQANSVGNPWTLGFIDPAKADSKGYPVGDIPFTLPTDITQRRADGSTVVLAPAGTPLAYRTVIFTHNGKHYPAGDYTLIFDGAPESVVQINYQKFTGPGVPHKVAITPGDSGILISIIKQKASDPVRNIRFIMPGFESTYLEQPFHPLFLDRIRPFKMIRFMDWVNTNGSNVVSWNDRNSPDSSAQTRKIVRTGAISSIVLIADIPYFSPSWGHYHVAQVTTAQPHGLTTGQHVVIDGTDAKYTYLNTGGTPVDVTLNGDQTVRVIDATHFVVTIGDKRYVPAGTFTNGTKGTWKLTIDPGGAVEYMVDLANAIDADPWFCMPHAADDNYVRQFAELVKQRIKPGKKIYVEYSNEVWNYAWPFAVQWQYALGKGIEKGISYDASIAEEAKQDWDIWLDVFGAEKNRIQRVAAGQGAGQTSFEGVLNHLGTLSQDGGFDVISVASYIGPSTAEIATYTAATTVTDVGNDTVRGADRTVARTQAYVALRDRWVEKLQRPITYMAYEGGQHIIPPGNNDRVPYFQTLLDVQSTPLMYQAYNSLLQGSDTVGLDGLVFYSSMGTKSRWGSWGHLEYQEQPIEDAPKYEALLDYIAAPLANITYTITATANTGGTISPAGTLVISRNTSPTFTATPAADYRLVDLVVDGVSKGALTSYTFHKLSKNHSVEARFLSMMLPPSAPPSLVALGTSSSQITVNWTTVDRASSYVLERSRIGTGWTVIANPPAGAITFTDSGLSSATTYTYRLKTRNPGGDSGYSPLASATTRSGSFGSSSSAPSTLTEGLVAYYPLDGAVNDASGGGNNGTIKGAPTYGPGKIGQALTFSQAGDYVQLPSSAAALNFNTNITLAAWFKVGTGSNTCCMGIVKRGEQYGADQYSLQLHTHYAGSPRLEFKIGTVGLMTGNVPTLVRGAWNFATCTADATTMKCYLNGVPYSTTADRSAISSTYTANLPFVAIGTKNSNQMYFKGDIDDVRIYNRVLSADEVQQLYLMGQ